MKAIMNIARTHKDGLFFPENTVFGAAYVAAKGYENDLREEIRRHTGEDPIELGMLYITKADPFYAAWAQTIWTQPVLYTLTSIKNAAKYLKTLQRNWVMLAPVSETGLSGRAKLIQSYLPPIKQRHLVFPEPVPRSSLGHWVLLSDNQMLLSQKGSNPFPLGVATFQEDRLTPPNRAYLKLWEAFTLCGCYPAVQDYCLDLGASPGGWSWVLAQTGCQVVAIDKAALDPKVAALENVRWQQGSAFSLEPTDFPKLDWVLSDIICYPEKSYELIQKWWVSGICQNMICTIKFQRPEDAIWLDKLKKIPGGRLHHLYHNKHEVTWFGLRLPHNLPTILPGSA